MKTGFIATLLAALVIGSSAVLGWVIRENKRQSLVEEIKHAEIAHDAAKRELQVEFKRAESDRLETQRQRWRAARGSDLEWAAKDPENAIAKLFEQVAKLSSPDGSSAEVSIDRFTEFSVLVRFRRASQTNSIPSITRNLMQVGSRYLAYLRFALENQVVAELSPSEMVRVPDWTQISDENLMALAFRRADEAEPTGGRVVPPGPSSGSENTEDPGPMVWRSAVGIYDDIRSSIRSAAQELDTAIEMEELNAAGEFQKRRSGIAKANQRIQEGRAKLGQAAENYRNGLRSHGFSPTYIKVNLRRFEEVTQPMEEKQALILDALESHSRSANEFLLAMQEQRGNWTYLRASSQVEFRSAEAQQAYRAASSKVKETSKLLSDAIQAFNRLNQK